MTDAKRPTFAETVHEGLQQDIDNSLKLGPPFLKVLELFRTILDCWYRCEAEAAAALLANRQWAELHARLEVALKPVLMESLKKPYRRAVEMEGYHGTFAQYVHEVITRSGQLPPRI